MEPTHPTGLASETAEGLRAEGEPVPRLDVLNRKWQWRELFGCLRTNRIWW